MSLVFLRDSFFGRVLYHLSGHRFFKHKEENIDFIADEKYLGIKVAEKMVNLSSDEANDSNSLSTVIEKDEEILVTWDGDDDPENPYNWSAIYKLFFCIEIAFLTTSVYMGSAIYTPGIEEIMKEFGTTQTKATLPLTMFVIGYGLGPMFFSPLSENAMFGRTYIYIVTLFIFFILQIPTALSKSIAALSVLRFLGGFFASPCLATGGASIGDVITLPYIPLGIATWAIGAVCGPTLGPLIGSVLTVKGGWRWTFWFMCIISGGSFLFLTFMLPETYGKTLLRRKAQRLRALTGNQNIVSEGEVENRNIHWGKMLADTFWRPLEITFSEPVVLSINLYLALVYSLLYLWFEAFPIAYLDTYGFTLVEMGVSYVSIMIGVIIGAIIYILIIRKTFTARLLRGENVTPEVFIPIAILAGCLMPIGVFIFGWTVAKDIHWIGSLIGAAVFAVGAFMIFQTLFNYLSMSFWQYLASVFAGSAAFRSIIAGCFPLFGKALFDNLADNRFPVGWGSSLVAFILVGMVSLPILFYLYGPQLRARSRFSSV